MSRVRRHRTLAESQRLHIRPADLGQKAFLKKHTHDVLARGAAPQTRQKRLEPDPLPRALISPGPLITPEELAGQLRHRIPADQAVLRRPRVRRKSRIGGGRRRSRIPLAALSALIGLLVMLALAKIAAVFSAQ